MKAVVWQLRVMEDSGCSIMGRVYRAPGSLLTQATATSISVAYRRTDISQAPTTASLTVASVVFDTLQTDGWDVDTTGYNFRWDAAASIFTKGDGTYAVTFTFTPTVGAVFKVTCEVKVQKDLVS